MIAQLTGNFLHKSPTKLLVDVNGVGYEVHISLNTFSSLGDKNAGTLLTYLKVSEDAMTIFGFWDMAEKEMFVKLIGVSGVGAQTARVMLSSLKPTEIQNAIAAGNLKILEGVKGIGKKTAERIALELRDKLGTLSPSGTSFITQNNTPELEALEGLIALGIGKTMAEQAIKKAIANATDPLTVETIIKLALKHL